MGGEGKGRDGRERDRTGGEGKGWDGTGGKVRKGEGEEGREGEGEDGSQSHPPLKYLRSATETVLLKLNKTLDVQF